MSARVHGQQSSSVLRAHQMAFAGVIQHVQPGELSTFINMHVRVQGKSELARQRAH